MLLHVRSLVTWTYAASRKTSNTISPQATESHAMLTEVSNYVNYVLFVTPQVHSKRWSLMRITRPQGKPAVDHIPNMYIQSTLFSIQEAFLAFNTLRSSHVKS